MYLYILDSEWNKETFIGFTMMMESFDFLILTQIGFGLGFLVSEQLFEGFRCRGYLLTKTYL